MAELAIQRGLMESHQILETPHSEEEPYFELLKEIGPEKLMNDKKPDEFRKELY